MSAGPDGLGKLSEREKRMLRLLGRGHAIKTAALAEDITENAAHELLRSARRKLGVPSSRDAARLLAGAEARSQEIRDGKPGIATRHSSMVRSPRTIELRSLAMGGPIAIAAGALALLFAVQSGSKRDSDVAPTSDPPRVVATSPAQGAVIAPGPYTLSVTFDRAVAPQSYSYVQTDEPPSPNAKWRRTSLPMAGPTRCNASLGLERATWSISTALHELPRCGDRRGCGAEAALIFRRRRVEPKSGAKLVRKSARTG